MAQVEENFTEPSEQPLEILNCWSTGSLIFWGK